VDSIDRLGCDGNGRVEPERHVRTGKVVVDRLWDSDDLHPRLEQLGGHAERILPSDRYERFNA
jgi:hypothetical protein